MHHILELHFIYENKKYGDPSKVVIKEEEYEHAY